MNYILKREIGKTKDYVSVFEAETDSGLLCALKVLVASEGDEEVKRLFQREVEALQSIPQHRNVVRILDHGYQSEDFKTSFNSDKPYFGFYIAQELIDGESLQQALINGILPPDEGSRLDILIALAEGFFHIHKHGRFHRDIKPQNVMFRKLPKGLEPVIIDFGISKIISDVPPPFTLMGAQTPMWAPPEYIARSRDYTRASDIFGYGLISACILAGRGLMWQREHTTREDVAKELDLLNGLSTKTQALFQKCLSFDPENRPQTFSVILDELVKCKRALAPSIYCLVAPQVVIPGFPGTSQDQKNAIQNDLCENTVYFGEAEHRDGFEQSYVLLGKKYFYHIARDRQKPNNAFRLLSVHHIDPIKARRDRSDMLPLKTAEWDIYDYVSGVPEGETIPELLESLGGHLQNVRKRRQAIGILRKKVDVWSELIEKEIAFKKQSPEARGVGYNEVERIGNILVLRGESLRGADFYSDQIVSVYVDGAAEVNSLSGKIVSVNSRRGEIRVLLRGDCLGGSIPQQGMLRLNIGAELRPSFQAKVALKDLQNLNCPEALKRVFLEPDRLAPPSHEFKLDLPLALSESKKEALELALNTKEAMLLQGPPGTGKTTFISALVCQLLSIKPGQRILVSAQSNVALDHALDKIRKELSKDFGVIRIGNLSKISKDSVEKLHFAAQAKNWADEIRTKVNQYANYVEEEVRRNGEQGPLYAKVLEFKGVAKDELGWSAQFREAESRLQQERNKYSRTDEEFRRLIAEIGDKKDLAVISEMLGNIQVLKDELVLYEEESDRFAKELDDIAGIQSSYKDTRLRLWEELKNKLGDVLAEVGADSPPELQIECLDAAVRADKQGQSGYLAILRQWEAKLAANEPSLVDDLLAYGVSVVGATCVGASSQYLSGMGFDWAIVDEAARANPGELAIPLMRANKYVLVGDHQQLPPFIDIAVANHAIKDIAKSQRIPEAGVVSEIGTSLFESLYKLSPAHSKRMLREQFRMIRPLGRLVAELFYDKDLDNSNALPDSGTYLVKNRPILFIDTSGAQNRHESQMSPGFKNLLEAVVAKAIFSSPQSCPTAPKSIAVLAPYRGQCALLSKTLEPFNNLPINVSTVDNFQGHEADVVLYSCVRSNNHREIGFLSDVHRLTVALSRARSQLIVVGDGDTLRNARVRPGDNNLFHRFLNYISSNPEDCEVISSKVFAK